MHFKDNIDMKVNDAEVNDAEANDVKVNLSAVQAHKHIQKLQTKVAQYEQEKLRLKKKDKKIEQVKLCHQDHNQEAARIVTSTISEIESDVDARLD